MSLEIAELFRRLTHGVYVIGVAGPEKPNAFTAAWVMQVSFKPLMVAISINPGHSSYRLLKESGCFSVNVLAHDQFDLALHYGQPSSVDKLAGRAWHPSEHGVPMIDSAIAQFECTFEDECTAGDHRVVVGRVVSGKLLRPDAVPMIYRDTGDVDGAAMFFPDRFDQQP
ncbi:MAG: flavin reductase family protein [Methylotetracoccus sp.]|nr:flavin reductase family protein [Methylotetracoccus sp.]